MAIKPANAKPPKEKLSVRFICGLCSCFAIKKTAPEDAVFRFKQGSSLFDESLFALVLDGRQQHDGQQQSTSSQQASRQRTRHKHAPVTT